MNFQMTSLTLLDSTLVMNFQKLEKVSLDEIPKFLDESNIVIAHSSSVHGEKVITASTINDGE